MSVAPRLNRLFDIDGRCCEVAMDHGVHNEPNFLAGISNLHATVRKIAAAGPDAILLSFGQAHLLQQDRGRQKPSLVVRADPTNFYGTPVPIHLFCQLVPHAAERAIALDSVAILVNLIWASDQPSLHHQCVRNVSILKRECERFGVPLMVEALLMHRDSGRDCYVTDSADVSRSVALVRHAVELGADVIKTDVVDDLSEFGKIIEAASGKPVLVRGGARISDSELLSRTHGIMALGAAGIVYGRNIYQHPEPDRILRACNSIVHGAATVARAASILAGESDRGRTALLEA